MPLMTKWFRHTWKWIKNYNPLQDIEMEDPLHLLKQRSNLSYKYRNL